MEASRNKLDVWNQNSETRVLGTALMVSSCPFQKTGLVERACSEPCSEAVWWTWAMTELDFVRPKNTNPFLHLRAIIENGLHPYRSVCHIFKACQVPVSLLWTSYRLNRQYHTQDGWREFSHQLAEVAPRAPFRWECGGGWGLFRLGKGDWALSRKNRVGYQTKPLDEILKGR